MQNSKDNQGEGILDVYPDAGRDELCYRSGSNVMQKKSVEYPKLSKNDARTSAENTVESAMVEGGPLCDKTKKSWRGKKAWRPRSVRE